MFAKLENGDIVMYCILVLYLVGLWHTQLQKQECDENQYCVILVYTVQDVHIQI